MSNITTTQPLSPVNFEDIKSLSGQLDQRLAKAKTYKASIDIEISKGITQELDTKLSTTIDGLKAAKADFNAKRSPLTKKIQDIVKLFTEKENDLQKMIDDLQSERNKYAAKVAAEIAEQQKKNAIRIAKDNEAIDLKKIIEIEIRTSVHDNIHRVKNSILSAMKTVTQENKDAKRQKLQELDCSLDPLKYGSYETKIISRFNNDVIAINNELLISLEPELSEYYRKEIEGAKQEALLMFNQIANMDDKAKGEAIEAKTQDIAIDTHTAIEVVTEQAEISAEIAKAETAFSNVSESMQMPDAKQLIEIEVLNMEGWSALSAYWWATCAKDFKGNPETKTWLSMKKDVEKVAVSTGEKISSQNIIYVPIYKAK